MEKASFCASDSSGHTAIVCAKPSLITVVWVCFFQMFDLFDKVIEFNHNPTSESAKRKLDLVRILCCVLNSKGLIEESMKSAWNN